MATKPLYLRGPCIITENRSFDQERHSMKKTDPPVVVEQIINAPISKVWNAISDLTEMHAWFFEEIESFEPTAGFETQFQIEHEGKTYLHQWKIIEVEPGKRIVYDWQYEHCEGQGKVEWDLVATEVGTKLTLTNSVVESFPDDDPAFTRESCEGGWQFLLERLTEHLTS